MSPRHEQSQSKERLSRRALMAGVLGIAAGSLTACGGEKVTAEPAPETTSPALTPEATPSQTETTDPTDNQNPQQTETETTPHTPEVDVMATEYFKALTTEQQTRFKELYAMEPEEVAKVGDVKNLEDRNLLRTVIVEGYKTWLMPRVEARLTEQGWKHVQEDVAYTKEILSSAPLSRITIESDKAYINAAYDQVQITTWLAGELAATADEKMVSDAKKIVAGLYTRTLADVPYGHETPKDIAFHPNLESDFMQIKKSSAAGENLFADINYMNSVVGCDVMKGSDYDDYSRPRDKYNHYYANIFISADRTVEQWSFVPLGEKEDRYMVQSKHMDISNKDFNARVKGYKL